MIYQIYAVKSIRYPISTLALMGLAASCGTAGNDEPNLQVGKLEAALNSSVDVRVSSSSDDAEESSSGSMSLTSTDLELVTDGYRGAQKVGMRFTNVTVPQRATVTSAHLIFATDETGSSTTSITFRAQAADNAPSFTSARLNISNRPLTSASTSWAPTAWTSVGQTQASPDISSVLQEVIDRAGWASGNALVVVATGSGTRTAESYNGSPSTAPLLHVEYQSDPSAAVCGDSLCSGSETCSTCASDCGACATCSDGVQNQGEADIDCGGPCAACSGGSDTPTAENLLVAFIGDQGNNGNSDAVLQLIASEGADAVVHNGDFDYADNPTAWDNRITSVLGNSYPYFAIVGNHDAAAWSGSNGYAAKIQARHARNPEMACTGELGVRADCTFRGLHMIQSCIGTNELRSSCNANSVDQVGFIHDSLAASTALFKVCNWHKNQQNMQVGSKTDEVGWSPYQECMNAGAIVSTGHEHSYSRTLTLTNVGNAGAAHGATGAYDLVTLSNGSNFVFVSGLAGVGLRPFTASHSSDAWWASYYTSDRWYMNGQTKSGVGNYGALFIRFYVNGNPNQAHAYFKDVSGRIVDDFTIQVQ